jgi:uncharacterized protein involved in exopolysaccharide biosynthesis
MELLGRARDLDSADPAVVSDSRSDSRRANRRRLIVFLGVFLATATIGLTWDFLRPAEYRATSRLQITPAAPLAPLPSDAGRSNPGTDSMQALLAEVESLSSRPLIEEVANRLQQAGYDLSRLGPDPILALQSTLTVTPVPGTNVVELEAIGAQPELPTALISGLTNAYREQMLRAYTQSATDVTAKVEDETARLEAAVAAKRRTVEAFRLQHNIVSPEREENAILAQLQGLGKALREANDRLAAAEGKLRALKESAAAGRSVVRARDNPTLANLEQRASQARETLRTMEQGYTPDYLAMDPQVRQLRDSLAELERQIQSQRQTSGQAALAEAEEELTSAKEASRRLQAQIAQGRHEAGQFAARFSEYTSLRDELAQLEKAYQEALQRKTRLDATVRARMPSMQIVEQAALPKEPWRPLYWRDAGIVVIGSVLLALFAMWLVELFNRSEPQPAVVVAQPVFAGTLLPGRAPPLALSAIESPRLPQDDRPPLLAQPYALPRELSLEDTAALLRAADPHTRRAILLLLAGVSPEELLKLQWGDVDHATAMVRVGGPGARQVKLGVEAAACFQDAAPADGSPLIPGPGAEPASLASLSADILCAAHDAGLADVDTVTPVALRHTYLAYLVRQGIRFSDLTQLVGSLPREALTAYSALAPAGQRLPRESVATVFPAQATAS